MLKNIFNTKTTMITGETNFPEIFKNIWMIRLFFFSVSDVKFSPSILPNEGYLEITIDNKKNKVCDTSANNQVKEVICRQFGYQGVNNGLSSTLPNIDNSKSFSGGISCSGEEQMLSHCCVTEPTFLGPDCLKSASISCKYIWINCINVLTCP